MDLYILFLKCVVSGLVLAGLSGLFASIADVILSAMHQPAVAFSQFGVLLMVPRLPAIHYVDTEWLLKESVSIVEGSGLDSPVLETKKLGRLGELEKDRRGGDACEVLPLDVENFSRRSKAKTLKAGGIVHGQVGEQDVTLNHSHHTSRYHYQRHHHLHDHRQKQYRHQAREKLPPEEDDENIIGPRPPGGCFDTKEGLYATRFPHFRWTTPKAVYNIGVLPDPLNFNKAIMLVVSSSLSPEIVVACVCYSTNTGNMPLMGSEFPLLMDTADGSTQEAEYEEITHLKTVQQIRHVHGLRHQVTLLALVVLSPEESTWKKAARQTSLNRTTYAKDDESAGDFTEGDGDGNDRLATYDLMIGIFKTNASEPQFVPHCSLKFSKVSLRELVRYPLGNCKNVQDLDLKVAHPDVSSNWYDRQGDYFFVQIFLLCEDFVRLLRFKLYYDSMNDWKPDFQDFEVNRTSFVGSKIHYFQNSTLNEPSQIDELCMTVPPTSAYAPTLIRFYRFDKEVVWELGAIDFAGSVERSVPVQDAKNVASLVAGFRNDAVTFTSREAGVRGWPREPEAGTSDQGFVLWSRRDGLLGSPDSIWRAPGPMIWDPNFNALYYVVDEDDGFVRFSRLLNSEPAYRNRMHAQYVLFRPSFRNPQRSFTAATLDGHARIIAANRGSNGIAMLGRVNVTCTIRSERLFGTESGPTSLAVSRGRIVHTEPFRPGLITSRSGKNVSRCLTTTDIWPSSVAYNHYIDRFVIAEPRAQRILSLSATEPCSPQEVPAARLRVHFDAKSVTEVGDVVKHLRPHVVAVDQRTGDVYFTTLPVPNITAFDLLGDLSELERTYLNGDAYYGTPRLNGYPLKPNARAYNLASSIWILRKKSGSLALLHKATPFYTNPDAFVTTINIHGDWIVFVERLVDLSKNITVHVCRIQTASASGLAASYRREPKDGFFLLPQLFVDPTAIFAPIGTLNLWDPQVGTDTRRFAILCAIAAIGFLAVTSIFAFWSAFHHHRRKSEF